MSTAEHISPLSVILEPAIVAGLLTAGCLLNRRRASDLRATPVPAPPTHLPFLKWAVRVPDTSRFRGTLTSRFLACFPFLIEVWYWLNTYWIYQIARAVSALTLVDETTAIARAHGLQVLQTEAALGLGGVELAVQRLVMRSPFWMDALNRIYSYVHIPATISFMVYAFRYFHAPIFRRVRRTLVACNLVAFIVFTAWPCMPPRLLPAEYGFVDTVHKNKHASAWTTNKFQNQLAAMPSLHFGYSFVIGMSLFFFSPHKWMARAGPFYPALILLAIVCTANHYVLDAVAGFGVACIAWKGNWLLLNLRPLEEWGFWLCRTEKPLDKEVFLRLVGEKHLPYPVTTERDREAARALLERSSTSSDER